MVTIVTKLFILFRYCESVVCLCNLSRCSFKCSTTMDGAFAILSEVWFHSYGGSSVADWEYINIMEIDMGLIDQCLRIVEAPECNRKPKDLNVGSVST
jgi:hypothetical protein